VELRAREQDAVQRPRDDVRIDQCEDVGNTLQSIALKNA